MYVSFVNIDPIDRSAESAVDRRTASLEQSRFLLARHAPSGTARTGSKVRSSRCYGLEVFKSQKAAPFDEQTQTLLPLLGGLLLTFSLPSSRVFGQAGETIIVTATPIPVERVPVFLSGTWYVFASGQSPGTALGGDLGGTPAPEMNTVSPVAQYIAVTGWDIVAEDAAHRYCSNDIDNNDRLGTDHGGTNRTRTDRTGVDVHITHRRPDGTRVEYFTATRPSQFTPRSQGGC